jgi:protein-disulfide isomerase
MASAATLSIINADVKTAQSFGANSTPTFVLNGKKIDKNPQSLDAFKKLIDDAIAQKNPS